MSVSLRVCVCLCLTEDHPDCEAAPGAEVQLHHEVDVDEHAEDGQPGQQRDLERSHTKDSVLLYHTLEDSWLPPVIGWEGGGGRWEVTLKVSASLLWGCLQMMKTHRPQSSVKTTQDVTTAGCAAMSSGR